MKLKKNTEKFLSEQIKSGQKTFQVSQTTYSLYKDLERGGYARPDDAISNIMNSSIVQWSADSSFKAVLTGDGENYFINKRNKIINDFVKVVCEIAAIFLASYLA